MPRSRDALETPLMGVAAAMERAADPWWVIGSAAAVLHGADTAVGDVDLLVGEADATALLARLNVFAELPDADPRFRSRVFARWRRSDHDVEIMAGTMVAIDGTWRPIRPRTRLAIGGVYVPDRLELITILARFGRPKDQARIALLAAV